MILTHRACCAIALLAILFTTRPQTEAVGADKDVPPKLPKGFTLEEQPRDAKAVKIVLIAGSSVFKAGEHEYIGGCAVLMDLLRQTPGVAPVLAVDWPQKPETL